MEFSAPKEPKKQILITNVGSYLGSELAKSLIKNNCQVFGIESSHLIEPLLTLDEFTLLELNLAQPVPSYLPKFDLVFDLSLLKNEDKASFKNFLPHISPALSNLLSLANEQTKVVIVGPTNLDTVFYDYLTRSEKNNNIKLFLLGDLYGQGMPLKTRENELASLIHQAVRSDRVILENEGLRMIYPLYITDAISALNSLAFSQDTKNIEIIVSEEPKTALTVAYDIQSAARLALQKELGLYFSGSQIQRTEQEATIHIHLDFSPKTKIGEGLKKTLEYFKSASLKEEPKERVTSYNTHEISKKIDDLRDNPKKSQLSQKITNSSAVFQKVAEMIPRKNSKIRAKHVFLALILIIILIIGKTGLDLYMGMSNIQESKKLLESGNFESAQKKAKTSIGSLNAAKNKLNIIALPFTLAGINSAQDASLAISGAAKAAEALFYFTQGGQNLQYSLAGIVSKDIKTQAINQEETRAFFKAAYLSSSLSQKLLEETKSNIFKDKLEGARQSTQTLSALSLSSKELTTFLNEIIGTEQETKTYLVLLLNNNELRPGGGFIGNYALVEFAKAKLKNVSVEDIYTIDGQLKETIEPPRQLKEKLGVEKFYLRDSNWSADFAVNAQTARDFFKKETGKDVNGVVTIDLTFVQNLLKQMGPIKLEDYNEEINSENLFERGQYYSEVGFFPGSTQKRDFFSALTRKLVDKTLQSITEEQPKSKEKSALFAILETAKDALSQKHLMLTVDGQNIINFIKDKNWSPNLPPTAFNPTDDSKETRDFISLLEANLGANKVNGAIERKIDYELTVGRDADLVGKLTITYKNNSQAETWPGGKYVCFLRAYVPANSDLFAFENAENKDPKSVELTNIANLTQFGTYIEVPIKSTRQIIFNYRIPKNIKLEAAPAYRLHVQKQAGTGKDPFNFTFNLPAYLEAKSLNGNEEVAGKQNLSIESDLQTDRDFKVEVGKK